MTDLYFLMRFNYAQVSEFSGNNPDLSLLAIDAGIEIGNYLHKKVGRFESTKYLSHLLEDFSRSKYSEGIVPGSLDVLARAISDKADFINYWRGKKIEDLFLQVNLLSKDLRDIGSLSEKKQLGLLNFCFQLNEEIIRPRRNWLCRVI